MLTVCVGTSMNRVLIGINHYITTSELIGAGLAMPVDNKIKFFILVNINHPTDVSDWQKLSSRLQEISSPQFEIEYHGRDEIKNGTKFDQYTITLLEKDCDEFAKALMIKPGPMGWGSTKRYVDMAFKNYHANPNPVRCERS